MNAKKKLAKAKAKLKENAPQIAVIGSAAVAIAYGFYSITKKTIPVLLEETTGTLKDFPESKDFEMPSGAWEVVVAMSGDDLTTLSKNDSYEVTHIDDDLFRAKVITDTAK